MNKKFVQNWLDQIIEGGKLNGLILLFTVAFTTLFAFKSAPIFQPDPNPELDLRGEWEYCLVNSPSETDCVWQKIHLPADLPRAAIDKFKSWVRYRIQFRSPEICIDPKNACALFFQEIGDAVEAKLNQHTIGRHGQFPPNAVYAKQYPVEFHVSTDTIKKDQTQNELELLVYSFKKSQVGVRGAPIGVYTVENADLLNRRYTALNVIIPIISFAALLIIALVTAALAGPAISKDQTFSAFYRFGFLSACFLLSISEVPREYLPVWFAGHLHFLLRIFSDWALFELVAAFFSYNKKLVHLVRPLYAVFALAFAIQFFYFAMTGTGIDQSRGFDMGFLTLKLTVPLLLLPHVMGVFAAYKIRKSFEGQLCLILFIATFIFQLHDTAIFHGYGHGIYYVKWYPLLIGLVFGIIFLDRAREIHAKLRSEEEQIKQMKMIHETTVGVAHDLEEPLKGLEMACRELQRNPENFALVKTIANIFPTKVQKIYDLNKSILSYSRELSKPVMIEKKSMDLVVFLNSIIEEFRNTIAFKGVDINFISPLITAKVEIDAKILKRVIWNLLKNAAEACSGSDKPKLVIEMKQNLLFVPQVEIIVSDNGPGIAPEIRDRLFQPFETFGKTNGTGIGLATSRRLMEAHGGFLDLVESEVGAGFRVVM